MFKSAFQLVLAGMIVLGACALPAQAQVGVHVGGLFGPRVSVAAPGYYGPSAYNYRYGYPYRYGTYGYPAYGAAYYGAPIYAPATYGAFGGAVYAPSVGVEYGQPVIVAP